LEDKGHKRIDPKDQAVAFLLQIPGHLSTAKYKDVKNMVEYWKSSSSPGHRDGKAVQGAKENESCIGPVYVLRPAADQHTAALHGGQAKCPNHGNYLSCK